MTSTPSVPAPTFLFFNLLGGSSFDRSQYKQMKSVELTPAPGISGIDLESPVLDNVYPYFDLESDVFRIMVGEQPTDSNPNPAPVAVPQVPDHKTVPVPYTSTSALRVSSFAPPATGGVADYSEDFLGALRCAEVKALLSRPHNAGKTFDELFAKKFGHPYIEGESEVIDDPIYIIACSYFEVPHGMDNILGYLPLAYEEDSDGERSFEGMLLFLRFGTVRVADSEGETVVISRGIAPKGKTLYSVFSGSLLNSKLSKIMLNSFVNMKLRCDKVSVSHAYGMSNRAKRIAKSMHNPVEDIAVSVQIITDHSVILDNGEMIEESKRIAREEQKAELKRLKAEQEALEARAREDKASRDEEYLNELAEKANIQRDGYSKGAQKYRSRVVSLYEDAKAKKGI